MKHSERELESCLKEKIHPETKTLNGEIHPETKTIDITIDGEYLHEEDNEPLEKVDESLAYKKTHKPQREDECTGKCNTNVYGNNNPLEEYTDTDDCCMGDKYYKDDKCFDGSKINNEHTSKSPFEKMSHSEQEELKDLLEKSKKITKGLNEHKNLDNISHFNMLGTDNKPMLPDEKLIKEWKDYKSRVDNFASKHSKLPKAIIDAFMLDEYPSEERPEERPVDSRPWEIQEFEKITKQMFDTYKKKNADYGNSFDDLFNEFGMTSALLRIKDKYNRLKSITEKNKIEVKNESVEDTLLDMANYAILTVIKLRRDTQNKNAER